MLSTTVASWFAVGAAVSFLTYLLDDLRRASTLAVVGSTLIVATLSAFLAWAFMTSFSPYLVGTYVQLLVVAIASGGLRMLSGPVAGLSLACYTTATVVTVGFMIAFSAPFFHAEEYGRLMVPELKEHDAHVPLVDQTQARIVTDALAAKRAGEILASADEPGLGSRVMIGEAWGNKVGKTMYWLMPLEHSSVFKWYSNGTTPGYIAVSQMNEMTTKFVQDKPIRIGTEAWGDDNVYRHIFNRGFKTQIMGEAIFQVDEDWNPYWVVPLSEPQIGVGGEMPTGWAIVDATSGDTKLYTKEADVPAWVDRLYHSDMIAERFDDWGCWSRGWKACMFSGNDVIESAPGINVTIDANLDLVYYSGTQFENNKSVGATSGFYTANGRTGRIIFYRRAGITEAAAKAVMNGAYADFEGYRAADCVLLTLNGEAAFFSIIVDGNGSRKAFAIVSQTNRNVFGKGASIQAAVTDFGRSLQRVSRDAGLAAGDGPRGLAFEGVVLTLVPVIQNDRTSFYLTLDSLPGKVVEVSEEKIGEIVVTKVGDRVRFSTDNDEPGLVFSTGFDNLGFEFKEGPVAR